MTKIQRNKLVFVETTDNAEMNMALTNYRKVGIFLKWLQYINCYYDNTVYLPYKETHGSSRFCCIVFDSSLAIHEQQPDIVTSNL